MINDRISIILDTDSYKMSHFKQYPPGTQGISSYIEARKGFNRIIPVDASPGLVFAGIQYYCDAYLAKPITTADVDLAEKLVGQHGEPFNREGWDEIVNTHSGYLPIAIQALPEGSIVPHSVPMVQVINKDSNLPWLTSYIETSLLRTIWYMTTVATQSREIKALIAHFLKKHADSIDGLPFMLHDFGSRGVSSQESAGLGGLAHLINFMGTDTFAAIMYAREYYGAKMPAFSVPAAEHSTITSWGEFGEIDAYRNMLKLAVPEGIVSVVSDSYDIHNACRNIWGGVLRDDVVALGNIDARLVIRPDSGVPHQIIPEILEILWDQFGTYGTFNSKGLRVLPSFLRVLQGDGINYESIYQILDAVVASGFCPTNMVFGMGGALLQQVNRDTFSFAMKANAISFGDGWQPVFKRPKSDTSKASKAGRQAVVKREGTLVSIPEEEWLKSVSECSDHTDSEYNYLEVVWSHGWSYRPRATLELMRDRAAI